MGVCDGLSRGYNDICVCGLWRDALPLQKQDMGRCVKVSVAVSRVRLHDSTRHWLHLGISPKAHHAGSLRLSDEASNLCMCFIHQLVSAIIDRLG